LRFRAERCSALGEVEKCHEGIFQQTASGPPGRWRIGWRDRARLATPRAQLPKASPRCGPRENEFGAKGRRYPNATPEMHGAMIPARPRSQATVSSMPETHSDKFVLGIVPQCNNVICTPCRQWLVFWLVAETEKRSINDTVSRMTTFRDRRSHSRQPALLVIERVILARQRHRHSILSSPARLITRVRGPALRKAERR
jgi:hypothetical protein